MQNTEPTVPSTQKNKFLFELVRVALDDRAYYIQTYDTPLGHRWIEALRDNLKQKRILEKNFCFLGWADSKRDLHHLVRELNKSVEQINSFPFNPPYEMIHPFASDDFQYSAKLKISLGPEEETPGLRLKHEACNLLHRYFEELQGTAWDMSVYYKQADTETKYAIRQLNNLCHEIESWVLSYRKKIIDPDWIRPTQITTFLNAPRYDLHEEDFELFKQNRYDREMGGVYLHWSQVGKTLYEVFRDEDLEELDDATCSAINHQKYFSGEFDIEWGRTVDESHIFKRKEMNNFRSWLEKNNFDWNDPKLSLGYIKLGQVNLSQSFGTENFDKVYKMLSQNLNITAIEVIGKFSTKREFPHSIDSKKYKEMQIEKLKPGYDWSSANA